MSDLIASLSEQELKKRSQMIDEQLRKEAEQRKQDKTLDIILLGSADSGKTTLLRQLILLHGSGFSGDYRKSLVPVIIYRIRRNAKLLFQNTSNLDLNLSSVHFLI
jgi:stage III sporulation protein SpoIIIAA